MYKTTGPNLFIPTEKSSRILNFEAPYYDVHSEHATNYMGLAIEACCRGDSLSHMPTHNLSSQKGRKHCGKHAK